MTQYEPTREAAEAPVRRRRSSTSHASAPRKRKKRRKEFRFDLVVLAAVLVVVIVAFSMPQRAQHTEDPVLDPATLQQTQPTTQSTQPTPPPTEPPTTEPPRVPLTFTAAEEDLIYVRTISLSGANADSEAVSEALEAPLEWDLTDPGVTVLIIHSHISESYTLSGDQVPDESSSFTSDPFRTDDARYNMVAVGNRVAEILRENGIQVIHDTTSFEYPNSDYAYKNAREHLEMVLDENPGICLILDLHRDAVANSDGSQWAPTVTVDGKEAAEISMLIGFYERYDRLWDRNLSFAVKLGAQLNHTDPDLFRQLLVNDHQRRYNQDMGPVSMLIEVGTAGNTLEEALNGAELLAEAISDLALGANVD